jgi:hypothetical protein
MIDMAKLDTLHLLPTNDRTTMHILQTTNSHKQEIYSLCIISPQSFLGNNKPSFDLMHYEMHSEVVLMSCVYNF